MVDGLGVMLNNLVGNSDSVRIFSKGIGKEIKSVKLEDDTLRFEFARIKRSSGFIIR